MIADTIVAVACRLDSFANFGAFACVSREHAHVLASRAAEVYAANYIEKQLPAPKFALGLDNVDVQTFVFGVLHSVDDEAAVTRGLTGTKAWYRNGRCHRDNDRPAIIRGSGQMEWWRDGAMSRAAGLPTLTRRDGQMEWHDKKGQLHRDFGLPALIARNGRREYHQHGVQKNSYLL